MRLRLSAARFPRRNRQLVLASPAGNYTVVNDLAGFNVVTATPGAVTAGVVVLSGDLSFFTGRLNVIPFPAGTGKVNLSHATGGLPASASVVVSSTATLYISGGATYNASLSLAGGSTGEALGQLRIETSSVWAGPVTLTGNTTMGCNTGSATVSGVISGAFTLQKLGAGTIILSGTNTYSGPTTNSAGTLQGDTNSLQGNFTNAATLTFNQTFDGTYAGVISSTGAVIKTGAGAVIWSSAATYTGATTVTAGTLSVAGLGATTLAMNPASGVTATVNLNGPMTQNASALTTASVALGTAILNIAANILKGSSTQDARFGVLGFGYVFHTAGTLTPGAYFCVAITGANARGMYLHSGGAVTTSGNVAGTVGASPSTSRGEYVLTGSATFSSTDVGTLSGIFVGEVGIGIVTLNGGTMTLGGASTSRGLAFAITSAASCIGIFNLISGIVNTVRVQKVGASGLGYFNFHGGTLKALAAANSTFFTGLTQANVWPENGTIDNNAVAITIGQALIAPAGFGISAISTTGFSVLTGYTAPPFVVITGGTLVGATALAVMSGTTVTGFTVTNPGTGAGGSDTITVTLSGGGYNTTSASTTAVTLTANTSGGLTFQGSAVTTLSGASTYTGDTNVSAGTLSVTGSLAGAAVVSGGLLQGSGTVTGAVTVANVAASAIQGGTGAGTTTTLTTGALTFSGSTAALNVTSNGTTTCSLVTSTGAVTLGGCTVNLLGALNAGTYTLIGGASMSGTATVGTNSSGRTVTSCTVVGNNLVLVLT